MELVNTLEIIWYSLIILEVILVLFVLPYKYWTRRLWCVIYAPNSYSIAMPLWKAKRYSQNFSGKKIVEESELEILKEQWNTECKAVPLRKNKYE